MRENEIIGRIRRGEFQFPPADLRLLSNPTAAPPERTFGDGILEVTWGNKSAAFLLDVKATATPRMIEEAATALKTAAESLGLKPMLICPYLSEDRLVSLEKQMVSALDLNGNGIILTEDMRLWTAGRPNQFKALGPKRNPYRGDSSVFTRALLLKSKFDSLGAFREFAVSKLSSLGSQEQVNGLTMSTASRVIDALNEDYVIETQKRPTGAVLGKSSATVVRFAIKSTRSFTVVDKTRLLEQLSKNFRPSEGHRILGRTELAEQEIWTRLADHGNPLGLRFVATGIASAGRYKVLSGVYTLSVYVTNLELAQEIIPIKAGKAFSNLEFIEEQSPTVYFDARKADGQLWSSPIQCWLELANAGPREQEASQELMSILRSGKVEEFI